MNGIDRSKREAYLAATFPPALAQEGHAPGPFTDQVVEFLSRPIPIDLLRTGRRYIIVDAIEPNGNPLREIVRFRFRLMPNTARWKVPSLGGVDEPILGSMESAYYFHFRSDSTLQENLADLFAFVSEQLGELARSPFSSNRRAVESRPYGLPLATFSAGLTGLIAIAIVMPEARLAIAVVLASSMSAGSLLFLLLARRRSLTFNTKTEVHSQATTPREAETPSGPGTLIPPRR